MKKITLSILLELFSFVLICLDMPNKKYWYVNLEESPTMSDISPCDLEVNENLIADNFLITYFSNLNSNLSENFGESCSYVAITSVLSYYDSWFCDDIIPDIYDVPSVATSLSTALEQSPGVAVTTENISTTASTISTSDIIEFARANQYVDFETALIWNAYKNNIDFSSNRISQANADIFDDIILSYYGDNYFTIESYGIGSSTNLQTEKQNFIKDEIDSGFPCIVVISRINSDGSKSAHSVVAYDYDSSNIYGNFGWKGVANSTHHKILNNTIGSNPYTYISSVTVIKPTMLWTNTGSNNYVISNKNQTEDFYCYDGSENPVNTSMHKHSLIQSTTNVHVYDCSTCNYKYTSTHDATLYNIYNNLMHTASCSICGTFTHNHILISEKYGVNLHKTMCILCSFYEYKYHSYAQYTFRENGESILKTNNYCSECGQIER